MFYQKKNWQKKLLQSKDLNIYVVSWRNRLTLEKKWHRKRTARNIRQGYGFSKIAVNKKLENSDLAYHNFSFNQFRISDEEFNDLSEFNNNLRNVEEINIPPEKKEEISNKFTKVLKNRIL